MANRGKRIADFLTWRNLTSTPLDAGRHPVLPPFPPEYRAVGNEKPKYMINQPLWPKRSVATYVETGYRTTVVTYACVNVIADAIATAPLRVYREVNGQLVPLDRHPARRLLAAPNPSMGEAGFMEMVAKIAAVTGFCVIEKERSASGRVVSLWPLRSDYIRPVLRSNAATDWEYRLPDGRVFELPAEDVIVVVYETDPLMDPTGIAPLAAASRELAVENSLADFVKLFLDQGAVPQYALIPQDGMELDQDEADLLRERWKQRYGGLGRSAEVAVLSAIKDIRRIGLDINELAYPELRGMTALQLCTAFRVPPILIGLREGLENGTYSNYGQARRSFYEDTVQPLWSRIDDAFTRQLLREFETDATVVLDFDTRDVAGLQLDTDAVWTRAVAAWEGGVLTRNEARLVMGFAPVDGADVFVEQVAAPELATPNSPDNLPNEPNDDDEEDDGKGGGDGEVVIDDGAELNRRVQVLPAAKRARFVDRNRREFSRIGGAAAADVEQFLEEQARRIAAAARDGSPATETRNVPDVDWADEEDKLWLVLLPYYRQSIIAGYRAASKMAEKPLIYDVDGEESAAILATARSRVTGITETTKGKADAAYAAGVANGDDGLDVAEAVLLAIGAGVAGRAMTIGPTEAMLAFNFATARGLRTLGYNYVQLSDNPAGGSHYSPVDGLTCADRHGLIVEIGKADLHTLAEHPNGSLTMVPVIT